MKLSSNMGNLLLALWLILTGLSAFIKLGDLRQGLDLLAMAAGILLLVGR